MTRRDLLLSAAAAHLDTRRGQDSALAVEGYIFEQHARSLKKNLLDTVDLALGMVRRAGFRSVELGPAFFPPEGRKQTVASLRAQGLHAPSLYVGGILHEIDGADRTIATALELGGLCAPLGCRAIVTNPDPKPANARKTDADLGVQADSLNRMGRALARRGLELRVHHHTPQLEDNAREWRHILRHTDPEYVHICVDIDWAYEGGFEPIPFLRDVGGRLREIHVRSARNKVWLEDVEDSDIDYRKVADYLKEARLAPLIVVELAYRPETVMTRSLEEDLRISRAYTERIFGLNAAA